MRIQQNPPCGDEAELTGHWDVQLAAPAGQPGSAPLPQLESGSSRGHTGPSPQAGGDTAQWSKLGGGDINS